MEAPGNDGNASMPEQVKRPNPWRKMMMMIVNGISVEVEICNNRELSVLLLSPEYAL